LPKVYKNLKKTKWRTPKVDKNKSKKLQAHKKNKKCPKLTKQNYENLME
jgi:phage-related tail protein